MPFFDVGRKCYAIIYDPSDDGLEAVVEHEVIRRTPKTMTLAATAMLTEKGWRVFVRHGRETVREGFERGYHETPADAIEARRVAVLRRIADLEGQVARRREDVERYERFKRLAH